MVRVKWSSEVAAEAVDLRVCHVVAERGDARALAQLSHDPDPEVRDRARARSAQQPVL